jgi:hypothetical protein
MELSERDTCHSASVRQMEEKGSGILVVETTCGLCNRLRAIDSAIALSSKKKLRLHIIWFADHDLNCKFSDLFEPLPTSVRIWQLRLPRKIASGAKRLIHAVARRYCEVFLLEEQVGTMVKSGHDFGAYRYGARMYLKTWDRFCPSDHPFSMFRPVRKIVEIVEGYSERLSKAVGVHIRRRTEANWLADNSPTQNFIEKMRSELDADPNVEFFLATDDQREENYVMEAFPGRVFVNKKRSRRRDDRLGIEDAVVDLYCLAKCRKILGSWRSSFSDTAILISGRPGVMIR